MSTSDNRVTKHDLEALLLNLNDQLNEFPTDEVLREDGIPEAVIAELNQMGQHIERAIDLLNGEE